MIVNRSLPILAGLLFLRLPASAQISNLGGDWVPCRQDLAFAFGARTESLFKSFHMVAGGVELVYKAPTAADPLKYGYGKMFMNEYFWSPSRFRIEYMVYDKIPEQEYLAVDGKIMRRLGPVVTPKGTNYSPSQGLFNVASDEQLVESWPKNFPKLLFSPFVGGNATLSRYLAALKRGVGGYKISTNVRRVQAIVQYQIYAERSATKGRPASTVEMIFNANPGLPTRIHTTYGNLYDLNWRTPAWYQGPKVKLPGDPFHINQ